MDGPTVTAEWREDGDRVIIRARCDHHRPPADNSIEFGNLTSGCGLLGSALRSRTPPEYWAANDEMARLVFENRGCEHITLEMITGARIRAELDDHVARHGCGTGDTRDPRYCGGFLNCPEGRRLWDAIADDEKPVVLG